MGFSNHKGTQGHSVASHIMTPDTPVGTGGNHTHTMEGQGSHVSGLAKSFRGAQSDNGGWAIHHTPATQSPESPDEEQLHVFRDASEAQHHLGNLMGVTAVRVGSGERHD